MTKTVAAGYVVEIHLADGIRIEALATKKQAHARGMELRRAGVVAYVFPAGSPFRMGGAS